MAGSRVRAVEQGCAEYNRCVARMLRVSSEAARFAKTGGLGALPRRWSRSQIVLRFGLIGGSRHQPRTAEIR
jgi:hypothetical protein